VDLTSSYRFIMSIQIVLYEPTCHKLISLYLFGTRPVPRFWGPRANLESPFNLNTDKPLIHVYMRRDRGVSGKLRAWGRIGQGRLV
jgi:hypothetical protein